MRDRGRFLFLAYLFVSVGVFGGELGAVGKDGG